MIFALLSVFLLVISRAFALDCTQIQDSQIFDGSKIYIPGGSGELQQIPANFRCIYTIKAPANSTWGFSANVVLKNGIKGVNDFIVVTEQDGTETTMNNRTGLGGAPYTYTIIPGAQMFIEITTKSVFMGSMFSVTVEYFAANIGPTLQMKTNGEMNYFDLSTLNNGKNSFKTVTFVGNEQIFVTHAEKRHVINSPYFFFIDGTIDNQTAIYYSQLSMEHILTISNAVTILSNVDDFFGVILNNKSEADEYDIEFSLAAGTEYDGQTYLNLGKKKKTVIEAANFESTGIQLKVVTANSTDTCDAYVLSGPPNDYSTVLLNITKPDVHYLDVKYLSLVTLNCTVVFELYSYQN